MAPNSRGRRDLPPPGTTTLDPLVKDPYLLFNGRFRFNPKWAQKPWSDIYFKWLVIISCAVWYNLIFIIARAVFHEFQDGPQAYAFAVLDYLCDTLYLLDMLIKLSTGYLENGILIREPRKLARRYVKSSTFIKDVLSLIPTDLLFIYTGWLAPWPILRINRLLRLGRVGDFYYRAQTRLDSPNTFRLIYLILTMIVVVHLNACVYYFVSSLVGIGLDRWAYPGRAGWRYLEGHHGEGHGEHSTHGPDGGNHTEDDLSHSIFTHDNNGTFDLIATHGGGDRVNGTGGLISGNGTEIFPSGGSLDKAESHGSTLVDLSNSHSPRGHHNSPDEADLQDNAGGSKKAKTGRRARRDVGMSIRRIKRQHEDPSQWVGQPVGGGVRYPNGSPSLSSTAGNSRSYQSQLPRTPTSGRNVATERPVTDNDDGRGRSDSNDIAMMDEDHTSDHINQTLDHSGDHTADHNVDSHGGHGSSAGHASSSSGLHGTEHGASIDDAHGTNSAPHEGSHGSHATASDHGNSSSHAGSDGDHGHGSSSAHGTAEGHGDSHHSSDGHGSSGHGEDSGHGSGGGHGVGGGEHGEGGGDEHAAGAGAGGHHKPIKLSAEFINDTLYKKYSYCMYWSVKMMTSKPYELANPTSTIQFVFHLADAFLGILMFATIVGEVDGIIESINKKSDDFKEHLDSVRQYISMRRVGKEMEARVVKWFDYIWANNGSLDEDSVLMILPEKLRMEIAKHVHLDVLKKVPIFQGIEEQFLLELAEKLKPQAFCPGDYVCRRGDIGREIYVVRRGLLNVIAADGEKVIVTLKAGVVFGELSLLNVPGSVNGNRRTVTVRSVGYADLFSLSKEDFDACLAEYPEVKDLLMEKARKILQKDNLINEEVAREQARRQRNFEAVADKLEESLDIITARLEIYAKEDVEINRKLAERLANLMASYKGIVPPKAILMQS
ncbi:hypothetical protein RvY_05129 [Ramazzottius varieornatus]|uniref:Cyclic nucleotide-binding domain-containing protein n=1 Tax=Ramazzottius varieornatus TaxID=947166 RepID=A0A1D1UXJ8_RAMVA|nr:hypothetical protein RvY_05129 [Ramazzottius varieornatus]